jgi:hypothetical protein
MGYGTSPETRFHPIAGRSAKRSSAAGQSKCRDTTSYHDRRGNTARRRVSADRVIAQPRTRARKARVFDLRRRIRARDGLANGGGWIRTYRFRAEIAFGFGRPDGRGLTGRALSTAQWPATPLRLGSGGFVEGGAGVERCCAAQIAGMSIVVWATTMHRAAVVPNHEIAGPPFMSVDEFGPGRVESEVVQ